MTAQELSLTTSPQERMAIFLHFSAVDALVIPDRDVLGDLSPEDLQGQVAEWLKQ